MDEPLVLISRLDELVFLANTNDVFEKAVIFSTTTSILSKFESSKLKKDPELLNLLIAACYFINAAIGYEFAKNKPPKQCLELARVNLDKIRNIINIKYC